MDGKIVFRVKYTEEYDDLVKLLSSNSNFEKNTNLLFEKTKLKNIISKTPRINLLKHFIKNTNNEKYAEAVIGFDDFDNLPDKLPSSYFKTIIYEKNKMIYCTLIITTKNIFNMKNIKSLYSELNPEEKNIIDKYISAIKLKFVFKAPNQINSKGAGRILNNKKTLVYECTLYELLNLGADVEISFFYKK
jgi:hypothetical protein